MFHFFSPRHRYSFKDIGLKCDIHSHILPGVDDGSGDVVESLSILRALKEQGVERVVLTPHVSTGLYSNRTEMLELEFERLKSAMDDELKSGISLRLGSEYMIDEDFLLIKDKLTYRNKRILVEMSYSQRSVNLLDVIFNLVEDGYEPVLAHPERYVFYYGEGKNPYDLEELEKLIDMGCLFQLNVLSMTGAYGSASLSNLKYFLDHDWYSFIGTDIHSRRLLGELKDFDLTPTQFEKVRALAAANEQLF